MHDSPNLTPKQHQFCCTYMETGNATLAYRNAYDAQNMKPATVNRKAKELLDNGKIAARLAILREPIREKMAVTVEGLTEKLQQICELSMQRQQFGVAVTAIMGIAKMHGLLKQKIEVECPWSENLTVEEIEQEVNAVILEFLVDKPLWLDERVEMVRRSRLRLATPS